MSGPGRGRPRTRAAASPQKRTRSPSELRRSTRERRHKRLDGKQEAAGQVLAQRTPKTRMRSHGSSGGGVTQTHPAASTSKRKSGQTLHTGANLNMATGIVSLEDLGSDSESLMPHFETDVQQETRQLWAGQGTDTPPGPEHHTDTDATVYNPDPPLHSIDMATALHPSTEDIAAAVVRQLRAERQATTSAVTGGRSQAQVTPTPTSTSTAAGKTGESHQGMEVLIGQFLNNACNTGQQVQVPMATLNASGAPLTANVKQTTKMSIWAGEYIEFGSLLNPLDSEKYHIAIDNSRDNARLSFEPASKARPVQTIDQWTNAFLIFTAVYAEKFPLESPQLMKYGTVVREMATRAPFSWKSYDTNFRKLKQWCPSMTWDYFHTELWATAFSLSMGGIRGSQAQTGHSGQSAGFGQPLLQR